MTTKTATAAIALAAALLTQGAGAAQDAEHTLRCGEDTEIQLVKSSDGRITGRTEGVRVNVWVREARGMIQPARYAIEVVDETAGMGTQGETTEIDTLWRQTCDLLQKVRARARAETASAETLRERLDAAYEAL